MNSADFPWGHDGTSVYDLAFTMLKSNQQLQSQLQCLQCASEYVNGDALSYVLNLNQANFEDSDNSTFKRVQRLQQLKWHQKCSLCHTNTVRFTQYINPVNFIIVQVRDCNIKISRKIKVTSKNEINNLSICGVIYHGEFHFTARIINIDGTIFYHDGITTQRQTLKDRHMSQIDKYYLNTCKGKQATLVIYARK